ncbi:hypothetical protein fugu_001616 [Takifugu bimaculatus]|uniref:Uncharacterized protein n=1 Tax=Takifugu bimaculatus TaxID=433685 RepID=A0A4Z2BQ94_9TELE|nr:hypothetical protein fugu_001616 [Takifugu bimaculatus]
MSVSPLALSPGAYAHTYMVYPGFMPTPSVISAQTLVQSQMPLHSEGEAAKKSSSQKTDSVYMDSPFYITYWNVQSARLRSAAASNPQHPITANHQHHLPAGPSDHRPPIIRWDDHELCGGAQMNSCFLRQMSWTA